MFDEEMWRNRNYLLKYLFCVITTLSLHNAATSFWQFVGKTLKTSRSLLFHLTIHYVSVFLIRREREANQAETDNAFSADQKRNQWWYLWYICWLNKTYRKIPTYLFMSTSSLNYSHGHTKKYLLSLASAKHIMHYPQSNGLIERQWEPPLHKHIHIYIYLGVCVEYKHALI